MGDGGCVCESREVSKDAVMSKYQRLQPSKANLGTVHLTPS